MTRVATPSRATSSAVRAMRARADERATSDARDAPTAGSGVRVCADARDVIEKLRAQCASRLIVADAALSAHYARVEGELARAHDAASSSASGVDGAPGAHRAV